MVSQIVPLKDLHKEDANEKEEEEKQTDVGNIKSQLRVEVLDK